MKLQYEWYEDDQFISVFMKIPNTSLSKIDIYVSDFVLKINIPSIKFIKLLDLKQSVKFDSVQNHFLYKDQTLSCKLEKEFTGTWGTLLETGSKPNLELRRQSSFRRREQYDKEKFELSKKKKIEHDSFSVQQQMKVDQQQREKIINIKSEQKENALQQVYSNIDDTGNIKKKQAIEYEKKWEEIDTSSDEESKPQQKKYKQEDDINDNEIFVDEDFEVPEIRNQQTNSVKLEMTQKPFPGVAAREKQFTSQPFPKSTQIANTGSQEETNPIWLKEKGDGFLQNQDFYSALNAYNQALKIDGNYVAALMNRSLTNMSLFNFDEIIRDSDKIIEIFTNENNKLMENTQRIAQDKQQQWAKTYFRKCIALSWKGQIKSALELLDSLKDKIYLENINQEAFQNIRSQLIKRQQSIQGKTSGDNYYRNCQFKQAQQVYEKIRETDQDNEIIISNLSIISLKQEKYEDCLELCDQALQKTEKWLKWVNYTYGVGSSAFCIPMITKIRLRRVKALQGLKREKDALEEIKKILKDDDKNKQARDLQRELEAINIRNQVEEQKEKAADYLKENKIQEALHVYQECLKKLNFNQFEDILLYCSILLNKSVCHLKQNEMDDIISTCVRGIKIIQNFRNRVISFQKSSKDSKEKLNNFEMRFLVRRGNAYLKQGQLFNALTDMEDAQKIDPQNKQIKDDIQKIRLQANQ